MSSSHYVGFVDGACRSTHNLYSVTWVLYDPNGELINLQGICLGRTTNNIVKYNAIIDLLSEAVSLGIRDLVVKLDSQTRCVTIKKSLLSEKSTNIVYVCMC